MDLVQLFALPGLILVLFGCWLRVRGTDGKRMRRFGLPGLLALDVWLICVAAARPLGPHLVLGIFLGLVNAGLIRQLISDVTGRDMRVWDRSPGRYRSVRGNSGYNGYRGD